MKHIEAMKQALEALEKIDGLRGPFMTDEDVAICWKTADNAITSLRQAIAEAEKQEPVACMRCNTPQKCSLYGCSPLTWPSEDAHPQLKREWVGLTDEEIDDAAHCCVKSGQSVNAAIRSIEAKLKEKNA